MKQPFTLNLDKEDRIIRGDIFIQDVTRFSPVVIMCHGFKGFKDWGFFPHIATSLSETGFIVITFNFSMNGIGQDLENYTELEKFAKLTFSREQEDLQLLMHAIDTEQLPFSSVMDKQRVGLFGHSRGGGNALLFALENKQIKAVCVWNTIHRVDFFDPTIVTEINEKGRTYIINARTGQKMPIDIEVLKDIEKNYDRFNLLHQLPNLPVPITYIQGDHDLPGFLEGTRQLHKSTQDSSLHVIAGANHTLGCIHPFKETTPYLEEAISVSANFYKNKL